MEKLEFEKQLLVAIKKDDLKSFRFLMPTNADLNLCYGRFPILSLLYLYSSFKILSKYEKALMPIHNFKVVDEPIEIYKRFRIVAGKSLRLFRDEQIVYPVLMLAVLNERLMLQNNYKFLFKNVEVCEKIDKIYNLNTNFSIIQNNNKIYIPERKLTKSNYILASIVTFLFCLVIAFVSVFMSFVSNTNGIGTMTNPIQISTASEFLRALKNGNRYYNLNDDVEISAAELTKSFSGTVYGNGHRVKLVGDFSSPIIKELSGNLVDLKFCLTENAIKITQNGSIISEKSTGNIENCEIIGNFTLEFFGSEALYFGLFSSLNYGRISGCNVSISATLSNGEESDAYFGGFAGLNGEGGEISNCSSDGGVIQADTVDIAGVAAQNYGSTISCVNTMQLSQNSSKEWHPNVAGIAIANYGTIKESKNYGDLSAESKLAERANDSDGSKFLYYVFVGGISCDNYNLIENCRNFGSVSGKGLVSNVVVAGLVAQNVSSETNSGTIQTSLSKNNIIAKSEKGQACAGGVVGVNSAIVSNCGFVGSIDADSNSTEDEQIFTYKVEKPTLVFAGGVVGVNNSAKIQLCYADVNFVTTDDGEGEETSKKLYAGIAASLGVFAYNDQVYLVSRFTEALDKIDTNYYVSNASVSDYAFGVFATTVALQYLSGTLMEITDEILQDRFGSNQTAMKIVLTFSDIPTEVILDE